ncbi:MAG: PBP1A family penicillin-binding protein [Caldithrix sp.]|nr:MAG: PBP1A family penicillin-binding protein [Caldithrix sp.]
MRRKFKDSEPDPDFITTGNAGGAKKRKALWAVLAVVLLAPVVYLFLVTRSLPSLQQLEAYKPKLAAKVYSSDMKVIHEYYLEKRSFVPLEEMPESLIDAVIATEDRRFYDHWGMDIRRLGGAFLKNVIAGSLKKEGASTLTQQLARQLYLSLEKTYTRKIKELITAIQIERTYTKPEILEMYLNHMYFGHSAYGAQSAAITFFGKDLQDIDVDESAILIGVLKAPNRYSPIRYPNRCLTRRNIVLRSMHEMNYIDDEMYANLVQKPIEVDQSKTVTGRLAPYFTEYIRQILQKKYGYDLYTDGLSIYTTLDSRAQACAERAVNEHMENLQKSVAAYYRSKGRVKKLLSQEFIKENEGKLTAFLRDSTFVDSVIAARARAQVALVSIDPTNGHIIAMVGGRDFEESKFNRAVQAHRQPGSAFKPFVYTVAIDNGYPPTYEVLNQPVVVIMENGKRWSPQNYDLSVGGPTTLREGLRRSLNLVTVRVLQSVIKKPSLVVEYAHKMGIKSELQAVDAIALGASDVTPMEITSAFGVFANGGVHVEPVAILRVEDKNGNILEQNIPRSQEVLRKETAFIITDLLGTVINKGTGASARWKYNFNRPAGGKTGTTNDYSDAWFVGFTPQVTTGVWVGIDDYTLTLGKGQTGASAALPIWAPYMKAVHDTLGLPERDFQMPDGVVRVEICEDSKLLARPNCPCNVIEEVFFKDLAPTEYCDEHVNVTRRNKSKRRDKGRVRF